MAVDFRMTFQRALPYGGFLEHHGTEEHRRRWDGVYNAVNLTPSHLELLRSFRRRMNVLCVAGPWCGDCVDACPIFQKIAESCPLIDLRFINRVRDFAAAEKGLPEVKRGTAEDPEDIRSRP